MTSRYKIVQESAGEGGFGKIDKAFDTELERYVAIKTLDPLFKNQPTLKDIERFRREAKILASLSHPNIPAIYDVKFSEKDGEFKIIFEWIEGTTVRRRLSESGSMSLDEVKKWFGNICSALEHAHSKEVIHRDIKPSNLIITRNKESCYVVDFGIALRTADIERLTNGTGIGTAPYMSQEQQKGEELGSSSDVYSLGVVLYECLAGKCPALGNYDFLSRINETIPPAIDELIQACLLETDSRIRTPNEFNERLLHALRPSANFAGILSEGPLHEIQKTLSKMDDSEYSILPSGQRRLMFSRLQDMVKTDKYELRNAVASFLAEMVRLAHSTKSDSNIYEYITETALRYGYLLDYSQKWKGNIQIRENLREVSRVCKYGYGILSDKIISFLRDEGNLEGKEKWFYHDLKILLQNLLANNCCTEQYADRLGKYLDEINNRIRQ